ncbi:unnamed protein product [Microthlaspi erraticum]|uniref:F-box associated beta-propeller type 3 domain-containing protein n=1 Tax=Microthlaspi erraticum TaxID=1685480 RepID=A0A6D2J6S2_9BRAS|nr:unnamed protein product [Microthlaspi erraticum]
MSVSLSRPRILLGYVVERGTERRLFVLSLPQYPQDSNYSPVIFKSDVPIKNYGFCNSVRGIICVSQENHFMICNPTTRQFIAIPNDPTGFDPTDNMFNATASVYLGYDESNDQYKIMRTIRTQVRSPEHSVCTLRLGEQTSISSWRRVESGNDYYCRMTNALCIRGVVYYGAWEIPLNSLVIKILSFDVASERLLLMEVPKEHRLVRLLNYQGKLGCFCGTKDNGLSLWILDDAKKQIWSKTCVFSPSLCDSYRKLNLRTCGATDAGEILFVSTMISGAFELFYYDIKKNEVSKQVKIRDISENDKLTHLSLSCGHVENII